MIWNGINVIDALATGSRVICNPPPLDTDEDWVLLRDGTVDTLNELLKNEWVNTNDPRYGNGPFLTFRKGIQNVILVGDPIFFQKWKSATYVAKRLNLGNKDDRVVLFQAVLYGNIWTPPPPNYGVNMLTGT